MTHSLRPRPRLWVMLAALAVLLLVGAPARAWVEKRVHSDGVTVDVERDGSAVVAHEILIGVRGSPLTDFTVEPVDADALPLEDATATLAKSGRAAGFPMPLTVVKEGTRLSFRVLGEKGLKSGTYLVRFGYRTDLLRAGRLTPTPLGTALDWQGPRFADGIDSARVVFRIPAGKAPPRLRSSKPDGSGRGPETGMMDESDGVFLATFRRAGDRDELEVVRPHVAKGEVVSWRILADTGAFDVALPAEGAPLAAQEFTDPAAPGPRAHRWVTPAAAAGALLAAVLYAGLVFLKTVWVLAACRERRATPRALLPIPKAARAGLAFVGIAAAVLLGQMGVLPLVAAACLLVSLVAATHLPPRLELPLRGPGRWVPLEAAALEEERTSPALPGRFLDAGHPLGFVLFLSGLVGFVAAAVAVFHGSPYHGVAVGLGASLLFPIFCTGRAGEVPRDAAQAPRDLALWLMAELESDRVLEMHPIGRVPHAGALHDELRLAILPKRPLSGAVAIEVGTDFHLGALGAVELPFVIVRVLEGSAAAEAFPKGLLWTRGRTPDERVAVLRPRVPTRKLTRDLVRAIVERLRGSEAVKRSQPPASPASSAGKVDVTLNAGTTSSPAHAT